MKNLLVLVAMLVSLSLHAQFPYKESFKNATSSGLVVSGAAKLTAANGIDAPGDGYLRLTELATNSVGYVYAKDSFPSQYGLTVSFEFFCWKPGANSTNQADGMTFFLFDASVNSFRPGGTGGSLGYAQYYSTPGMAKGYIGISIDEFGNFSSASDGNKNGGPGQQRGSVAVRGPGNGRTTTDYVYQTGVIASDPAYNAGFAGFTQRFPDSSNSSYRRMKIIMTPGSSLGANIGYKLTVIMYKGGATVTPVTLINNYDYPFVAPAKLQFGLAASTGAITNYHEIRNLSIDATNAAALLAPSASNDAGFSACQGQQCLMDVTANDVCNNTGGTINKATIDLDPTTAGRQTSFVDVGKGTYTVDNGGVVSFTPLAGYSGVSSISYLVADTYGKITAAAATISVTVSSSLGPDLVLVDPAAVCAPAVVDLTSPSLKTLTATGASFSYFASLNDANNNTNNINGTANAINASGTYYVRESLSGCATIKPMLVKINSLPTVANAGPDQNFCSSTGGQSTTLLANNPDVGSGAWMQVGGPTAATITYPEAATSPVSNMAKGVYLFRWSVSNGACPTSIDDIQISVGVAANAGSNQNIVNAAAATLTANAASPGVGIWSQVSGPAVTFANAADAATTVSNLVPGNNYVLQWKITNGGCVTTSTVTINNILNTIANAGPDRIEIAILPFQLAGNTPGPGNTGTWSIVSAPVGSIAVILFPNSPTATVSSITLAGDYTFRWTMANGVYSNYDDVTISIGVVLPSKLIAFNGLKVNDVNRLTWKTVAEESGDYFELERSIDNRSYQRIATISGRTNSGALYSYDDYDAPRVGSVLYRLKMLDKDGKSFYSPVVKINAQQQAELVVVTNPFLSEIIAQYSSLKIGKMQLRLYDNFGRTIKSEQRQIQKGNNVVSLKQLSSLPNGIYYLEVRDEDIHQKKKLVKQ